MIQISSKNADNPTQDTDLLVGNEAQRVKLHAPSQDIRCLCKYKESHVPGSAGFSRSDAQFEWRIMVDSCR